MRHAFLCAGFILASTLRAAAPLESARALLDAKRYPEARAALEQIVAAEPKNAAAAYWLGRSIEPRSDANALPEALKWYEKAVELEPNNATYLARYGGASLLLANRNTSITAATKGRDAMEKALTIDPDDLDTREGLVQFYQRAPWPIGSSAKANAQLEEIRKRDPDRAAILTVMQKVNDKQYPAAFKLCDEALARNPSNYVALYFFGRTADVSGENLERGRACLQKCTTLSPPGPSSPPLTAVWNRLGNVEGKLNHPAEARTAYQTALKLDPTNKQAAEALARLK